MNACDLFLAVAGYIFPFRDKPTYDPVVILIGASFPGTIGVRKIDLSSFFPLLQTARLYDRRIQKFAPIVQRHAFEFAAEALTQFLFKTVKCRLNRRLGSLLESLR